MRVDLQPATVVPTRTRDAVSVLTIYLILLIGIPSRLVFGPAGAVGTPAAVVGVISLLWWISGRIIGAPGLSSGVQPLRVGLVAYGTAVLISYAAGFLRPLESTEVNGGERALITTAAGFGIALLASEAIDNRHRLDALLSRISLGGTLLAAIGIVQFFTGIDIASAFDHLPGLSPSGELSFIASRSLFRRVAGTAVHPIEFGVVLTLIFPIAVYRVFAVPKEQRFWRVVSAGLIAEAVFMSVSRTGALGLLVAGTVLALGWSWRRRIYAFVLASLCAGATALVAPGLLGTIKSLFVNISTDPSYTARTHRYELVGSYVVHSPFIGRGFGTWFPPKYQILDNQYLVTVIESGVLGLVALAILFFAAVGAAQGARRGSDAATRDLGQALTACVAVAIASFATFDLLAFPMATGTVFLLLGCCGALWRVKRSEALGL
jgi:O-antigen ligase